MSGTAWVRQRGERQRIQEVLRRLSEEYAGAQCALNHENPYQLLVATILSAQCTDERVNQVTPALFRKYPDAEHLARADIEELQELIRSTGFFRNKSRNLKAAAEKMVSQYGGQVPKTMEEMLHLPGVARKTANVVLGTAYGIASGVVVDTHVKRLSNRLGLTQNHNPDKIEIDLQELVPRADWIDFSHWLIHHGRRVCRARKPLCGECLLADVCPFNLEKSKS